MLRTKNSHLDDEEFIRLVESKYDPLTTTELEMELADRFKRLIDGETLAFLKVFEGTGFSFDNALTLLSCLNEYDVDSSDELTAVLKVPTQLRDLVLYEDAFEVQLTKLLEIIKQTTPQ